MEIVMVAFLALLGWVFYLDSNSTDKTRKVLEDLLAQLKKDEKP